MCKCVRPLPWQKARARGPTLYTVPVIVNLHARIVSRSNGLFDACPLGPGYTCSNNHYGILGNEDRDGLTAARRRTLHLTSSTVIVTSSKCPILRRSPRRPNWGRTDRDQSTSRVKGLTHPPVQRGESESWEDHIVWPHDYPPFLSPHRSCLSHPFDHLHRFHSLYRLHWYDPE
jgi:hypothetical protein